MVRCNCKGHFERLEKAGNFSDVVFTQAISATNGIASAPLKSVRVCH